MHATSLVSWCGATALTATAAHSVVVYKTSYLVSLCYLEIKQQRIQTS
jgi:hypothetical protein